MIEDAELRDLFKAESEEQLQSLNTGLLALQSAPTDQTSLDGVFRAAHSLKGSARMLGVASVEAVAHRLEDALRSAKTAGKLEADAFEQLYPGVDALRLLVAEAVTEGAEETDAATVLARLGWGEEDETETPPAAPPPPEPRPEPEVAATEADESFATPVLADPQLRDLFRQESEQQLAALEEGLSALAGNPCDVGALNALAQAANGLKGSAVMLSVGSVQALARQLETCFTAAIQGDRSVTSDELPQLGAAVEAMRALVAQSLGGPPAGVDVAAVLAGLTGAVPPPETPAAPPPPLPPPPAAQPAEPGATAEGTVIDDPELCALFKAESEEHLQTLDEGLLKLEEDPTNQPLLQEVFRAAHSLKGSARMLEIHPVEVLAHRFEDRLSAAKEGQLELTPDSLDQLYQTLVAVRQHVEQAVTGTPAAIDLETALSLLEPGSEGPAAAQPPLRQELLLPDEDASQPATESAPPPANGDLVAQPRPTAPTENGGSAAPPPGREAAPYRIETIRVDPHKLDGLMTQAGELVVTKLRVAHHLADIEELIELAEDWQRELTARRRDVVASQWTELAAKQFDAERQRLEQLTALLANLERDSKEDSDRLELVANNLEEGIRSVRMLPLSTVFNLFPRTVRDLARQQGKDVRLVVEGEETTADKRILEDLKDPLMHMVRNAVDHGLETPEERQASDKPTQCTLALRAFQTPSNIVVEVEDDGRGLNVDKIRQQALKLGLLTEAELASLSDEQAYGLITRSGFSTSDLITDVSGRGVGMDVVHANIERLKGSLHIESAPGLGTKFQIRLPLTLATTQVLLFLVDGRPYALPVENVETTVVISPKQIFALEGRETVTLGEDPVSVVRLADLLELPAAAASTEAEVRSADRPAIVLTLAGERLALLIDELLDEQEVVLKPHSRILRRVRNVAGSTILETGEVCIVLNAHDLLRSARKAAPGRMAQEALAAETRSQRVLLVEDSLTTRVQMVRILEGAGYEVTTAVDGLDALEELAENQFDAVVSDVQMPNMTGLELTEKIRADSRYTELPVILVTSLASEADRRRGAEAGADAYITKPAFDQTVFLETLRRLL